VEDETYSCGTGVTAAAIAYAIQNHLKGEIAIQIKTKGGTLSVSLVRTNDSDFKNIWLTGPAVAVFTGQIDV
jgi:diaminopimelate epimerase